MRRLLLPLALLALTLPATAEAGTYHVYSCAAGGRNWANNAWKTPPHVGGVNEDINCNGGVIGLVAPAGAQMADGAYTTLSFTSPAGTTIADFALTRQVGFTNPVVEGTHRYYLLYTLGSTHFAGGGNCCEPTRNVLNGQKSWYGYPEANFTVARSTVSRGSFPALNTYAGNANVLALRLGCYPRQSPCSVGPNGGISHLLYGTDITINDPTLPAVTVEAAGLLAGGARDGSDPVTLSASDSAGIKRVELIDVTDPAAPRVVGYEDYSEVRTDANRICDYSLPNPCPALSRETVRPASMPAGQRAVLVRVTDTGGNITDRGPYAVTALTPSDRGALNGSNATETGTLDVSWTAGGKRGRTLDYAARAGIRGRLLNSAGTPIAGAKVTLLTRDLRRDAALVPRVTLVTGADGTFRTAVSATASRLLHFAWLSRANDVRFAANAYLSLQARADATLSISTRRPRVGRTFTLSGRLRGVSRGGVTVILQGRARGGGRYATFTDTTSSSTGRFKARYRFRTAQARGRRFVFRARILPAARFPYATGYSETVTVRVS